ncbi:MULTISPECIES: amylo-alpha-1,6-glucosidase [Cupriavidus]|uniref:Amylo-alpha-1,6-glucosidase n=1 Tax=Cupriavidus pinatubonensis (strain JMP 134 / LMG 1197) TaxID=264198 RepID=Q474V9_CUPPJ|nr:MULTISPECIES: amylo-alpha-1,6-glucosidase [Cupriavidus]QYY32283.1 amylo-alpha-1,6-glucosidase [Cupriavidus pinatubonensis]TPQ39576.1 amylo-alpha-1,6-glucosidase [Cupriavidus pinatubonensis]
MLDAPEGRRGLAPEATPAAPIVIAASRSLRQTQPRTLKQGDTFAVFDEHGDAIAGSGGSEGLYYCDTRHLSHFHLTINGWRPVLLSSVLRDDNVALTCDLTNPDLFDEQDRLAMVHDLIHVRRSRFLWQGTCYERLAVRNFDEVPRRIALELAFAADFADLFEVRGAHRIDRGQYHAPVLCQSGVRLAYTGLDDCERTTHLSFDPLPSRLTGEQAVFELDLTPHKTTLLYVEVCCCNARPDGRAPRVAVPSALRAARRALRGLSARAASVTTSNEIFNEAVSRSMSDLYMLTTQTPYGPYPYAGIPWFSTFFGRDALITALETLWLDPGIARGVLCYLAANQATTVDPAADAEPGKILHESRKGEMANLGEVPFRRYYGSIDSTPLFVMLAGAYLDRTHDVATARWLWPYVEAALRWIDEYGDRDGDGFVEYGRRTAEGLLNQGWKDSRDSISHADGTLAEGPIALVEVQAYVYGAWMAAARIARGLGKTERADGLEAKATQLRQRFDEVFFDEALGTYVLALDGNKRPCRVRSSNAGHALFTGIAQPQRAEQVASALMASASFSGWGVRTLASSEFRYNPMSYHNGSVWPHDNALIAAGLVRYGLRDAALRIFDGLFSASTHIDLRRLPELFCGFVRQGNRGPTLYPVACIPQAWAAAAPLSLLQSCLNLDFDVAARQVSFRYPALPSFMEDVALQGLTIADASVDLMLRRAGSSVVVNVVERRGDVLVTTTN